MLGNCLVAGTVVTFARLRTHVAPTRQHTARSERGPRRAGVCGSVCVSFTDAVRDVWHALKVAWVAGLGVLRNQHYLTGRPSKKSAT